MNYARDWLDKGLADVPAPKRKRSSPERTVQVTIKRWLETVIPGCIPAAVKNEHKAQAQKAISRSRFYAKRKAEGVVSGFPDLVVLMPGGRTVLIEVKAPKNGTLSDMQDGLHTRLSTMGHPVIVANSIETARHGLHQLGIELREAAGQLAVPAKVRVAKPRNAMPKDRLPA